MFLDSFTALSPKCFCSLGWWWWWWLEKQKAALAECEVMSLKRHSPDCFKSRRLGRAHNKCYLFLGTLQASRLYRGGSVHDTLSAFSPPGRTHNAAVPRRHAWLKSNLHFLCRPTNPPVSAGRDLPSFLIGLRWTQPYNCVVVL